MKNLPEPPLRGPNLYANEVVTNQRGVGEPAVSWWLDAPRDGFADVAKGEYARMQTSRFGKITRLVGAFR